VAVVATTSGSATGYDRATGEILWRVDLAPGFRSSVAVTPDQQALIMGAGTTLASLDPISGGERWRVALPGEVRFIQMVGTDAVVSGAGYVTRVDTQSAATRWITPLTEQADPTTGEASPYRVRDVGGVLVVSAFTVTEPQIALWALEPDTGAVRWQVDSLPFALFVAATPAGDVIALSWEGGVAAFETVGGQRLWDRPSSAETRTILVPTRDGVIAEEESVASLLDPASGASVWSATGTVWGAAGDTTVLRTPEGLTGVATATGEIRWQLTEAISTADVLDDRVVVVTADLRVLVVAGDTGAVLTTSAITEPGFVAWYLVADENGALALPETGGPLVYVAL
jgi:outer membrane protein assembly factor BamB